MASRRASAALIVAVPMQSPGQRQQPDRLLCRFSDLVDGRSKGFDPLSGGRDTMFVVRLGDRVFGYRNDCPHYVSARMAWKRHEFMNGDRSRIMCAAHGALFRIEDGVCEIGPCIGLRLTAVPLEIADDGCVWLRGPYLPPVRK